MTTFVVTSAVPARRRDWGHAFRDADANVVECAGPLVACALLEGRRCAFLDQAEVAVYDLDSVTPALLPLLMREYPDRTFLFARDAETVAGEHRPSIRRFVSGRSARGSCFGGL